MISQKENAESIQDMTSFNGTDDSPALRFYQDKKQSGTITFDFIIKKSRLPDLFEHTFKYPEFFVQSNQ